MVRFTGNRLHGVAVGVALLALLGSGMAFAVADQSSRIARDLEAVQKLEGAATDAALYRANLAIAVAATATGDTPTVEAAVTQARSALKRIEAAGVSRHLGAELEMLWEATDDVSRSLEADDPVTATAIAVEAAGPVLNQLTAGLAEDSGLLEAAIRAEQAESGQVARLSSFSVALLAPALVLWSFRRGSRRRLDRQRLEAELRRTNDLARAKDELIAGLSHQLRTPLTGIQGFSATILQQAQTEQIDFQLLQEMIGVVHEESQDLGRMIEDFLVVSRADAGSLSFVAADHEVTELVRPLIEAAVTMGREVVVDVSQGLVKADAGRLRHLLRNLLDNAYRHGSGPVALRGRRLEDGYYLAVTDHGSGLTPDQADQAWSGFVNSGLAATVRGSLGVGLLAASKLATGLATEIAYRRAGAVTIFEFKLPLAAVPTAIAPYSLVGS
ncbi:MAG TPA: HAMP domain-containing sensor histidine kinase [Acidimicrobiia bacterium]|nr:HAMP domain-containing sensor histidine kinase [Acidimicrobiia bacterium]